MKKYEVVGGINLDALNKNINFFAKEGFVVISEIQKFSTGYVVLMERDQGSGEKTQ